MALIPSGRRLAMKIFFLLVFLLMAASPQAAQLNKIAAVVNGQIITMYDLQKESLPELARARINPNDPARKKDIQTIFERVLDSMILDILIAQEAKRLKATVSSSEVDNELTRMMKERGMTRKQMEEQLKAQKMTVEGLRKDIQKNLTRQKVMASEVGRRVVVTPQEISQYYEQHKDAMFNRDGLHMGLLVYNPKVNAASIATQIKSGKLSFEEACAKYSIAPNKDKAGDAGPIEWDRLNPEWEKRLTTMKPGDVTDLFDLQKFKAQVYVFRPGGGVEKQLTLQEATPQIDAILRQPKARERFGDYTRQLMDKAVIDNRLKNGNVNL